MKWKEIGLPVMPNKYYIDPKWTIGYFLTPGILPRSRLQSIGPNGNSILARVLDLINVMESSYFTVLNMYCKIYSKQFHYPQGFNTLRDLWK